MVASEVAQGSERTRVRCSTTHGLRRALVVLVLAPGCGDDASTQHFDVQPASPGRAGTELAQVVSSWLGPPRGSTTFWHVQRDWTDDFEHWWLDGDCRPRDAIPSGVLVPIDDRQWRATAVADVRVPCGERDAVVVHVRDAASARIDVPDVVHAGETFTVIASVYDREGNRLDRNDDDVSWTFVGGVGKGSREGCMDIRQNYGDTILVHANTVGDARIQVELSGASVSVDVVVQP